MKTAPAKVDEYTTLTRSDVEWTPTGEKPCTCGKPECLLCLVESLAVPVDDKSPRGGTAGGK